MADTTIRGRFVWHELITTDTRSAASFFTTVAGWRTQASPHDPSYTMFLVNGRPVAGLMALPADAKAMGMPPSWVCYIGTPDVDATARQAASLGGKILKPPTDIPTIGRFAVLADPQGGVFVAFTPVPPQSPAPADATAMPEAFSWHELSTTDWRAALTFYQRLFGWEATTAMDMGPEMGTYQMFGFNGKGVGGMFNKPTQIPGPPAWAPYIHVPDSKKVVETVKKIGGRIVNGPTEVPGGDWIAQGLDLQGAAFAVHSLKPAASEKPPAKKAAKKVARKKAPAKKAAKKVARKKAPAKKAPAKKVARKKAPVKKAAKKKASKKKATKKAGKAKKAKNRAPKRRR